jgi:hypothetical protein
MMTPNALLQPATLEAMTTLMALIATVQPLPPWQADDDLTFNLLIVPTRDGV